MPYASMQVPAVWVIRLTKLVDVKKFVAVKPKRTTTRISPTMIGTGPRLPVRTLSFVRSQAPLSPLGSCSSSSGGARSGPTTSAEVTRRLPRRLWTGSRRPSWARLR